MEKYKAVIFDIDGTLADLTHRLPHIKNRKKDWDKFHDLCTEDTPIQPMIDLCKVLSKAEYIIFMVSGRMEKTRKLTEDWLMKHDMSYTSLHLRPDGDYRPDDDLKREILGYLREDWPQADIQFVVDDRTRVVKMWREQGLICLQCAEWKES